MTHTVVIDEAERDRRFVNHLNENLRHCRIGRMKPKAPAVVDWSQYGWRRWFAWHPVFIVDRWYWLTHVVRRQWSNRPARYDYGRFRDVTPPKQGA